ncbi:hypothetical protein [Noviherbaspirillum soli]|uniref:hypothetical protein n=1 Tax=Noviherbaspirillum soli TaxID=1064518 RepID=UPI00188B219C|nr:hypothetical protein [Noviherbaspirillum soli]
MAMRPGMAVAFPAMPGRHGPSSGNDLVDPQGFRHAEALPCGAFRSTTRKNAFVDYLAASFDQAPGG